MGLNDTHLLISLTKKKINLMNNINKKYFFKKGYYIGKTNEIFDDFHEFESNINDMIKITHENNLFKYRYDFSLNGNLNVPDYMNKQYKDVDYIDKIDEFIKENNISVFQKWQETTTKNGIENIINYFRKKIEEVIIDFYPFLENNFHHHDNFTFYQNGDFIQSHIDGGASISRCCVIIIYLSDKKDYNDGGGEIVINGDNLIEKVLPISENFCILDFSENNLEHAVNPVKNNFKRYTYINFIHNKKEFELENKK
jgi:Rps23 Pro-64 3,4-dihydroxylase Tpa1-like proline 4-hydroxylase